MNGFPQTFAFAASPGAFVDGRPERFGHEHHPDQQQETEREHLYRGMPFDEAGYVTREGHHHHNGDDDRCNQRPRFSKKSS